MIKITSAIIFIFSAIIFILKISIGSAILVGLFYLGSIFISANESTSVSPVVSYDQETNDLSNTFSTNSNDPYLIQSELYKLKQAQAYELYKLQQAQANEYFDSMRPANNSKELLEHIRTQAKISSYNQRDEILQMRLRGAQSQLNFENRYRNDGFQIDSSKTLKEMRNTQQEINRHNAETIKKLMGDK
jgi:hypothetical protein